MDSRLPEDLLEGYRTGRLSRRSFLRATVALGLSAPAASLLTACGGALPPSPAPTQAPAAAPPATKAGTAAGAAPATAARTPAGELKVSLPQRIVALDPQGAQGAERVTLLTARHIFDSLVIRDPASGNFVPGLATSWQNPDDRTWVFTLRKGVKFHDGSEFTSADVKASLERVIAQKGPLAPLWSNVESIETPDSSTVQIRTKIPVGTLVASSSLLFTGPASKINTEGFFRKPIGTGPFKFVSWTPDAELSLEANGDYWGGAAGVRTLIFRDIPEIAARVTALETGEIDFTYSLPPDQLPALRRNADLKMDTISTYAYFFVWFNAKRAPFTDKRVRQAMSYALDLDTMAKGLLQGVGKRAQAPIPESVFGFAPQTPYNYDPARAKKLLAEAGHPAGFETTVQWNPGGAGPQDRELVQAMISNWNEIGVRVKSLEKERAQWLKDLLDLNWDMNFQSNAVLTGDADYTLARLYMSKANRTGYANPDLDKLLTDAAATVDQAKRKELYAQAQKIIWEDAVGIFPFDLLENYVYRKNVAGFTPAPSQIPSFHSVTAQK